MPGLPLCSLYFNTLLANLNARTYIGGGETGNMIELPERAKTAEQRGVVKLVDSAQQVGFHSSNWYMDHELIRCRANCHAREFGRLPRW